MHAEAPALGFLLRLSRIVTAITTKHISQSVKSMENGKVVHNFCNGHSVSKPESVMEEDPVYTTSNGCPAPKPEGSLNIGGGPLLLQDFHLIELLAHFNRERVPERVVHAKGAGAYGEFEVGSTLTRCFHISLPAKQMARLRMTSPTYAPLTC